MMIFVDFTVFLVAPLFALEKTENRKDVIKVTRNKQNNEEWVKRSYK